jgi:hypothetical protein
MNPLESSPLDTIITRLQHISESSKLLIDEHKNNFDASNKYNIILLSTILLQMEEQLANFDFSQKKLDTFFLEELKDREVIKELFPVYYKMVMEKQEPVISGID